MGRRQEGDSQGKGGEGLLSEYCRVNFLELWRIGIGGDLRSQTWYLFFVGAREWGSQGQPLYREIGSCTWPSPAFNLAF